MTYRWFWPLVGVTAIVVALGVWLIASRPGATSAAASKALLTATPSLTPVPTFTQTAAPTIRPSPSSTATLAPTALPTEVDAAVPATETPRPPATATRRPPSATATPVPPTPTATSSVAFKVIRQEMLSKRENGCEGGGHVYYINVLDKNGVPLDNVLIRRLYAGNIDIPATGAKGSGKTEDVAPRFAGDRLFVYRDNDGTLYNNDGDKSELTRVLSEEPKEIPIGDQLAGGFCDSVADCTQRIHDGTLCTGHYSYRVTFQRQW
jgi:hypothetical protein